MNIKYQFEAEEFGVPHPDIASGTSLSIGSPGLD